MTLVDTSVWISHLRGHDAVAALTELLGDGQVATHPFVVGELALGRLGRQQQTMLELLGQLPVLARLRDDEVMELVRARKLEGSGLGWVDAHLLAAALVGGLSLWTLDTKLALQARRLGAL